MKPLITLITTLTLLFIILYKPIQVVKGTIFLDPCMNMKNVPPLCTSPSPRTYNGEVMKLSQGMSLSGVVADQSENHYMLFKHTKELVVQTNKLSQQSFSKVREAAIYDYCNDASVDGASILFGNDGMRLVYGYFIAKNRVCVYATTGPNLISSTYSSPVKIPFIASIGTSYFPHSIQSLERDFVDYMIVGLDHDLNGVSYVILQNSNNFMLACYRSGSLLFKKQIATCSDSNKCSVLSTHYSKLRERLVISFFESGSQLQVNGLTPITNSHKSTQWVLLLNPSDGTNIDLQKIIYSTSDFSKPHVKFDNHGKLNIILNCNFFCSFLKEHSLYQTVAFLQYDFIKSQFSIVKPFISSIWNSYFTIHSIGLERDLTINAVISGSGSYSINDIQGRSSFESGNTILYKFRHKDGKILYIQEITKELSSANGFFVSTTSNLVPVNRKVQEHTPVLYTSLSGVSRSLMISSNFNYGNRYDGTSYVRSSIRYGGSGGVSTLNEKKTVISIKIYTDISYVCAMELRFIDGTTKIAGSINKCTFSGELKLSDGEYFTRIDHETGLYHDTWSTLFVLSCITFHTNKQYFRAGRCKSFDFQTETVPQSYRQINFNIRYGGVIDSIIYEYTFYALYSCADGYSGDNCNSNTCYGIESTESNVCNSLGTCEGPNNCSCRTPFYGSNCEFNITCNGILDDSLNVCSGRGLCISTDTCVCKFAHQNATSFCEKCDTGYFGTDCQSWTCAGIERTSPSVCSGIGICSSYNVCNCPPRSYGDKCEKCDTGYFGTDCQSWTCAGIERTSPSVCSGIGTCTSYNVCNCPPRSYGDKCEKCVSTYFGDKCLNCTQGDLCFNYLESGTAEYTDLGEYERFSFIAYTEKQISTFLVDCSKLFQDATDIIFSPNDWVHCMASYNGMYSSSSFKYELIVYNTKPIGRYTPRNPIQFNVFWWSATKTPLYVSLKLDASKYIERNKDKYILSATVTNNRLNTTMNRCYGSTILASYSQPERGTYSSISWKLVGKSSSLMNNVLVQNAINDASSTLTFPYVEELSKLQNIEITITSVSNFGFVMSRNISFEIDGSYPQQMKNYETTLTSKDDLQIPLFNFFDKPECIDGRTMQIKKITNKDNRNHQVSLSKDYMIVSPDSFSTNIEFTIEFMNGESGTISLKLLPPKVSILETVVYYKTGEFPSITVQCNNAFGRAIPGVEKDYIEINLDPWYSRYNEIIEYNGVPKSVNLQSLSLSTFGSYVDFSVSCYRQRISSNSYVIGKNIHRVYFVNENELRIGAACKVLGAHIESSVIPYTTYRETYYLEVYTNKPNCWISLSYLDSGSYFYPSSSRVEIGSYFATSLKSSIPFTVENGFFRYGSLAKRFNNVLFYIDTTLRNSDVSISLTFSQTDYRVSGCLIDKKTIEVGETIANLNCDIQYSYSSMKLLIDDEVVGTSNRFPIAFKATKKTNTFKLMICSLENIYVGNQENIVEKVKYMTYITINNLEFSFKKLLSADTTASIALQLSKSTDDYHKNNGLVVSLLKNVGSGISSSEIPNDLYKLVPEALIATTNSLSNYLNDDQDFTTNEISKYINQFKELSNPIFVNEKSAEKAIEMIENFVTISNKKNLWEDGFSESLSKIFVNVASKNSDQSNIKVASSIFTAAITLGSKLNMSTSDFFPQQSLKPSNLVSVSALQTFSLFLNSAHFIIDGSTISSLKFEIPFSNTQKVSVANSLFKYPLSGSSKRLIIQNKADYVSQLTISQQLNGFVFVKVPLPSFKEPSNIFAFRCHVSNNFSSTLDNDICKFTSNSTEIIPSINPSKRIVVVDCHCDLSKIPAMGVTESILVSAFVEELTLNYYGLTAVAVIPFFIVIIIIFIIAIILMLKRRNRKGVEQKQTKGVEMKEITPTTLQDKPLHNTVVTNSTITISNSTPCVDPMSPTSNTDIQAFTICDGDQVFEQPTTI